MQIALECKQCGAPLDVNEGQKIVKCRFCGSSNAVLIADKYGLYNRANYLRRNNEYDRAIGVYEDILKENPRDAEAYFGIAISKYGVEYVDDPAGSGKIPTLHRTRFVSILQDEDMKNAILYADAETAALYREEAEKIDAIQKKIWALTNQQEKYDIFICYKEGDGQGGRTQTSVYAQDIYNELTKKGYKVFFARKTLEQKIGSDYEPIIFAALYSAKVMLLVGCSEEEFQGVWVKNEWTRFRERMANGEGCFLIPVYRHMSPYELPQEFVNLQALDMDKIGFMQDLLDGIEKLLVPSVNVAAAVKQAEPVSMGNADNLKKRADLSLEQSDFKAAAEYIERALDIAPEDAECYIKKVQIETKCKTEAELGELGQSIAQNGAYRLALRFADAESRVRYQAYEKQIQDRLREKREAEEAERAAKDKLNAELQREMQLKKEREQEKKRKRSKLFSKAVVALIMLWVLAFVVKLCVMGPVLKEYAFANNYYKSLVDGLWFELLPDDWQDGVEYVLDKVTGIDYCKNGEWGIYDEPGELDTLSIGGSELWITEAGTLGVKTGRYTSTRKSDYVVSFMNQQELRQLKKAERNIRDIYVGFLDVYPVNNEEGRTDLICILDEKGNITVREYGYDYDWTEKGGFNSDLGLGYVYEKKYLDLSEVKRWKDIVSLKCVECFLFGLQADGEILYADMTGRDRQPDIDFDEWEDIGSLFGQCSK